MFEIDYDYYLLLTQEKDKFKNQSPAVPYFYYNRFLKNDGIEVEKDLILFDCNKTEKRVFNLKYNYYALLFKKDGKIEGLQVNSIDAQKLLNYINIENFYENR
ncbi:MAG: hypothetical protein N2114_06105 [Candidatus Goldbacteria bacterium]|nr:hypothetical protein [Candidatus Goldiibacteriota bacterium]